MIISVLILLDKQTLYNFYEEAKNMLDILEIAREDGEQFGRLWNVIITMPLKNN